MNPNYVPHFVPSSMQLQISQPGSTITYPDGKVEMAAGVPGPVVFTWNVEINNIRKKCWESPSFYYTDPSGIKHNWELLFCSKPSEDCSNIDHGSLTVKHCGNAKGGSSMFVIKLCVSQGKRITDHLGYERHVISYDDTTGEITPHNFSEESSYTIIAMPQVANDNFQLKVMCTILAKHDNTGLNESFLSQHEITLKKEYESLFESGNYSDVTFIIGKQKLQLHKSIISSRSPVLAAMFNNSCKESVSNEVYIEDQSYEVMKEFFRYVYAARVNNLDQHATELLILSNKYQVEKLKSLCERILLETLKTNNALERLDLANLHNAKNLESECVNYIVAHAKEMIKVPEFDIKKLPDDLANELFKLIMERS